VPERDSLPEQQAEGHAEPVPGEQESAWPRRVHRRYCCFCCRYYVHFVPLLIGLFFVVDE
jgi:hypothetical protein